jgi:hypothetical protein
VRRLRSPAREDQLLVPVGIGVARVVLVDEERPVEPEVLRVRAQEALDVRRTREDVELLLLQRAEVARTDLRLCLGLVEPETATFACLTECRSDLEQWGLPGPREV